MKRRDLLKYGTALLAGSLAMPTFAQTGDWPNREITVIVPVTPGSGADATARAVAAKASAELKVPVVVKNITGGGGLTGFTQMSQSPADGYTIGLVNLGALLIMPHTTQVPYTWDSFSFLGAVSESYYGVGVAYDSPIKTMADLVEAGKKGRVTFSANAPMNGISLFQIGNQNGAKFQLVLSNSQAEAITQAVGGHVMATTQSAPDMTPLIEGKQLRLLASASSRRWPQYPDIPTLRDLGYNAANVIPLGFACPAGVPKPIRDRFEKIIMDTARDPEVVASLTKFQVAIIPLTGAEFETAIKSQAPVVEQILEQAGMKKK